MAKLNFRTVSRLGDRKPLVACGKTSVPLQRIKGYFIRRSPWSGYFYAKGSRDRRCNGAFGRAIRGMKWNCYLKEGLKPLRDQTRDLRFLMRRSIISGLIHNRKAALGNGVPFQEGMMGASSFVSIRMHNFQGGVRGHQNREEPRAAREREGRPRIEAKGGNEIVRHNTGMIISSDTRNRPRGMDEAERNVMWFPGIGLIARLPEDFVKIDGPRAVDVSPISFCPTPERITARVRKTRRVFAKAPAVHSSDSPKARRKKIAQLKSRRLKAPTIAKPAKAVKKKTAKKSIVARLKKATAATRTMEAAAAQQTTHRDPVVHPWEYQQRHLPTIGWARKRERQLKVAVGAEAVPPKR